MKNENIWKKLEKEKQNIFDFGEEYRKFISKCKTERECVDETIRIAKKEHFKDLESVRKEGGKLKAGDKFYASLMGKTILLGVVGAEPIEKGMNIAGAHIDSPRLDLKPNPLYEDTDLALFDTHYYGGIKKYQWTTLPLALHGVVCKKNGEKVELALGESPKDPVLGVSDLLIHLAQNQMEKKGNKIVEGEDLNAMIASIPKSGAKEEPVKKAVLDILKENYGIEEKDFLSAELVLVPAGEARDYGIDRSMIMGYGQDDKVCAYPAIKAITSVKKPKKTCICLLTDKEEIGSVGATGMYSRFFENTIADLMDVTGQYSEMALRHALLNSSMLSADVTAAYDPNYPEVMEKNNCGYQGQGIQFSKYTGSRGKSGSNDASAEYIASLRKVMDGAKVNYQISELGKVDVGGGGTIAYIMANYGMNVIDCGVPVFNMHAPWEITSKLDIYETLRGYQAFYLNFD